MSVFAGSMAFETSPDPRIVRPSKAPSRRHTRTNHADDGQHNLYHGRHLGHTIGIPTCNQALPDGVVTPKLGVYASEITVDGKTYPLGSGHGRKLSEYLEELRSAINPSVLLGFGKKEYYPHQPMHLVADVSELEKDTGWKTEVGFLEGLKHSREIYYGNN